MLQDGSLAHLLLSLCPGLVHSFRREARKVQGCNEALTMMLSCEEISAP